MALDDAISELHKAYQAGQDKYTYFLLAAAGAAVAFSVQKTEDLKLSWWLVPVALSVVAWGASFYFGCKNLAWIQSSIYANFNLLELKRGTHPQQPPHPELLAAAVRGVSSALASNSAKAQFYSVWQFRLLVAGAVFFIAWRVLEMARIT